MTTINIPTYTGTIGTLTVNGTLTAGTISSAAIINNASTIRIGNGAGVSSGSGAIAIGNNAGNSGQVSNSIAIGPSAGQTGLSGNSIAIGTQAAQLGSTTSIAIGVQSHQGNIPGDRALAIGYFAGCGQVSSAGAHSICIGTKAGLSSCAASAIAISVGNQDLSPATAGFFCNGLVGRAAGIGVGRMVYDTVTHEIYYSTN